MIVTDAEKYAKVYGLIWYNAALVRKPLANTALSYENYKQLCDLETFQSNCFYCYIKRYPGNNSTVCLRLKLLNYAVIITIRWTWNLSAIYAVIINMSR